MPIPQNFIHLRNTAPRKVTSRRRLWSWEIQIDGIELLTSIRMLDWRDKEEDATVISRLCIAYVFHPHFVSSLKQNWTMIGWWKRGLRRYLNSFEDLRYIEKMIIMIITIFRLKTMRRIKIFVREFFKKIWSWETLQICIQNNTYPRGSLRKFYVGGRVADTMCLRLILCVAGKGNKRQIGKFFI